jgi:hypothetical protein
VKNKPSKVSVNLVRPYLFQSAFKNKDRTRSPRGSSETNIGADSGFPSKSKSGEEQRVSTNEDKLPEGLKALFFIPFIVIVT